MENNEHKEGGGMCKGMMCEGHGGMQGKSCCGWGRTHRFVFLRVILGIAILAAVFAGGVKLGEFKERIGGAGGYGWNGTRGVRMHDYLYGPQMMRGFYDYSSPKSTTAPR